MSDTDQEQTQQADGPEPEVEAKAREAGWRPEDEWTGKKDGWLPAEDFLERNERLQKRGDKILQRTVEKQTSEIAELKETIHQLGEHLTKADQRAYDRAMKDLQKEADAAAEDGDADAYKQARAKMDETKKAAEADAAEAKKKKDAKQAKAGNPDEAPAFQDFLEDHPWYNAKDAEHFDPELAAHAELIAPQIAKLGLSDADFYARIARDVKKKFPDKFTNQRRRQPNPVEGGSTTPRANGKSYADLPPEAKTACDKFVKQKVWHDIKAKDDADYAKQARDRYCADYFD